MNTDIGSLDLVPKHNRRWGDDGTTTRWDKARAMTGSIDLSLPVRSMRVHRQARTRLIVVCVALAVVAALSLRWVWRLYGL